MKTLQDTDGKSWNFTAYTTGDITLGPMQGNWALGRGEVQETWQKYAVERYLYHIYGYVYANNAWLTFQGKVNVTPEHPGPRPRDQADVDARQTEARQRFARYIAELGAILQGLDIQLKP